jgi:endonuclease/exonuclease/phosphatase family metal-dependent hydrolase
MEQIRIGTYDIQNIFIRYKFLDEGNQNRQLRHISYEHLIRLIKSDQEKFHSYMASLGWSKENFNVISKSMRNNSAWVITKNKPSILALQGVENMHALMEFNKVYLKSKYPYLYVWNGIDERQINLGLLSLFPVLSIRSHRFDRSKTGHLIFLRDCIEAVIEVRKGTTITLIITHLGFENEKSVLGTCTQAKALLGILKDRFGEELEGNFIVAGNFNAPPEKEDLNPLLSEPKLENIVQTRLWTDKWTQCDKSNNTCYQLDYLLLSPSLSNQNPNCLPIIEKEGLSREVEAYGGKRFNPRIIQNWRSTEHCPVFVDLDLM